MTKAPYDGKYLLNGHPFRMREGQPLPEGAVIVPVDTPAPETRDEPEPETKVEKAPKAAKAK